MKLHRKGSIAAFALLIFFVAGFGVMLYPKPTLAAFGISPPWFNIGTLMPGSKYQQTIYLVRDIADEDLPIEATLTVPDKIRPWFTFEPGQKSVIPKGVRQFGITITVRVPKDSGLGVYKGDILFRSSPSATGQVSIALGAQLDINLIIGDKIARDLKVALLRPLDIEEGWSPRAQMKAVNDGNVEEVFERATFELQDQYGAVRLAYLQDATGFEEIPAFSTKELTLEFPTNLHLGLGQYWASIAVFHDGKTIATQRTVFNVLKKGSLSTSWQRFLRNLPKQWGYYAGGGAGLVLLAGIAMFIKRRMRRRR